MNLNSLNLKELLSNDNLQYLDALDAKFKQVKNTMQETAAAADDFIANFTANGDDPRTKIKELEKQRKQVIDEMNNFVKDWMIETGLSAMAELGGAEGKFTAVMTTLIQKAMTGNTQMREMGDDFYNRDNTNVVTKPPILNPIPYFEKEGLDVNNMDINNPEWKKYFQKEYEKWQAYIKKYPIKKQAQDSEDFDSDTILSIVSYISEGLGPYIELYDAGKKLWKAHGLDKKVEKIDEEIEQLKKQGPSNNSGQPSQRLPNNEGAGHKENNSGKNSAGIRNVRQNASKEISSSAHALMAIANPKNVALLKMLDSTVQGVGESIGGFFTGLAQGNPDAFKQFLKSIVNTFLTSIQAMILGAKAASGAKAIGSFGLTLITDAPLLAAAWLALEAAKGIVQGLNKGGTVQGFGDTDTVPAMLTPGEYVIKKSVVNKFGTGFFEWINGGGLTNSLAGHYAGGGMVAAGTRPIQLELIGDVKISGRGNDLYGIIRKEQFRVRGARS